MSQIDLVEVLFFPNPLTLHLLRKMQKWKQMQELLTVQIKVIDFVSSLINWLIVTALAMDSLDIKHNVIYSKTNI